MGGFLRIAAVLLAVAVTGLAVAGGARPAAAETLSVDDIVSSVVRIKTFINPDGRTLQSLGREREGSGIVIDDSGLILTIGYLMVEAHAAEVASNDGRTVPAEIVGYDHDTGFGLLRTLVPLKVRPMTLGKSTDLKERDRVLIASAGGRERIGPVDVVSKREFAGSWEYVLSDAIFTSPPFPTWSGAALINQKGELVGVGSLVIGDATGKGDGVYGNMFVPIDALPPILADLMSLGRVSGPGRPWLGVTTEEARGRLFVSRVMPESPAERAGLRRGDVIVSVNGEAPKNLADFYRKVWAVGEAGVTVPLDVMQDQERRRVEIKSINRLDHLRLKTTF